MLTEFPDILNDRREPPVAELLETEPAPPEPNGSHSVLGITELLLKDPRGIDRLARDESQQPWLIPSLLAIAVSSFGLFALILVVTLDAAPTAALPAPLAQWRPNHRIASAVGLWLAYTLGFTLTIGVCLPSFWFYTLLAGVRASWMQVTAQMVRGQAATSMLLLGVVPIFFAAALGAVVFRAPPETLRLVLWIGVGLPFLVGMWGVRAIYRGFVGLSDTMPSERRRGRTWWLQWLTLACSLCYTAVCPVMIWTLWTHFAGQLAGLGL
jgi:hypothetical protein